MCKRAHRTHWVQQIFQAQNMEEICLGTAWACFIPGRTKKVPKTQPKYTWHHHQYLTQTHKTSFQIHMFSLRLCALLLHFHIGIICLLVAFNSKIWGNNGSKNGENWGCRGKSADMAQGRAPQNFFWCTSQHA